MEDRAPKVMISYTHDSPEHKSRVLDLANQLRAEGIDCHIDQYEPFPKEGWARWMNKNIAGADFVIVVCTETYSRRFEGREEPGKGLGGQWEGFMITQDLYEAAVNNEKFLPVVFSAEDARHIPKPLRGSTHFRLDLEHGYDDLYRMVTAQPSIEKPALGARRVLSPAVPSSTFKASSTAATTVAKPDVANLTLIFLDEERFAFVHSSRIERSTDIMLELIPCDAKTKAFLGNTTGRFNRPQLALAYGDTVAEGHVESVTTVHENGSEVWKVTFRPSDDNHGYSLYDITFNGISPDDMAELRARRILLNDKLSFPRGANRMEGAMIKSMINRSEGLVRNIASPLPDLYRKLADDMQLFLAASRLMCILYLKLAGVVEHVFKLDLRLESEATLRVRFEGQRRAQYSNVQPHLIAFDGVCELG